MLGSTEQIRTMIAVRHPLLLKGISDFLSGQPEIGIVATCFDGLEALGIARSLSPDVCILDVHLSRLNAAEFIRSIKKQGLKAKTLVLAGSPTRDVAEAIRDEGGEGLCSKDIEAQSLLETVLRLHAGEKCFPPFCCGSSVVSLNTGMTLLTASHELTRREAQIAAHVSAGLASKEVARRLHLSEGTVKVHLSNIYRKIGVANRTALAYALRQLEQEQPTPPRSVSMASSLAR